MKIWILIFSAALFVGGTCLGVALQPRLAPVPPAAPPAPQPTWSRPSGYPSFSVSRFTAELHLSDEQDRELDAILSESQDETQALGRALRAAQDKSRDRIVAILTPEQKTQLDALMAAERQKRSESELARTVSTYQKVLGLSDEQSKAFRTILGESRNRRREMYGKPGGDHHEGRKAAREEQNKALEKALTPDQYKRYLDISELERGER
jgi:Spy/CpxP family protein refolding chaperone